MNRREAAILLNRRKRPPQTCGEELLEFGSMGPVKLAIQLRCDTFALNRGRSPPASPKAAREAASEAVLRWLLEMPLALPTLGEAQAELV